MTWTTPTTRATGDLITASIWNTDLVNNLAWLYELLYDSEAAGVSFPTASITTPSLDQTYKDLMVELSFESDQASDQALGMRFNGDSTSTHYAWQRVIGASASATADSSSSDSSITVATLPLKSTTPPWANAVVLWIPSYTDATRARMITGSWTSLGGSFGAGAIGGRWLPTSLAAITTITALAKGTGNLNLGFMRIWGRR